MISSVVLRPRCGSHSDECNAPNSLTGLQHVWVSQRRGFVVIRPGGTPERLWLDRARLELVVVELQYACHQHTLSLRSCCCPSVTTS